ncbi:MAG: hypothetical protein IJ493_08965 [Clostridia bacterium]|nr:hypothetical protein [Clostridia bacterium]
MDYKKFKKLNIDLSPLGLLPGEKRSDYLLTPKGAKVIGWLGVDGIHFCFIRGFGEMVFAVDPTGIPGSHVHPLAENFEDFLRLLMVCGDVNALEQAYRWDRKRFDEFLAENPITDQQRAVIDTLRADTGLTPMADAFGCVKAMQAGFDYDRLQYKRAYYELPLPEPVEPEMPEWTAQFGQGFWETCGRGRPGQEIPIDARFAWNGYDWWVPSVYACGEGLVVDLVVQAEEVRCGFSVSINGAEVKAKSWRSSHWTPGDTAWNLRWTMEHFGCDSSLHWVFYRVSFCWATARKPKLRSLSLTLLPKPTTKYGDHFTAEIGRSIPFTHPFTGQKHTLVVDSLTDKTLPENERRVHGLELPFCYTAMTFHVEPSLPKGSFFVGDGNPNDHPRSVSGTAEDLSGAASIGIIGGADGPTAVFVSHSPQSRPAAGQGALSSLTFEPRKVIWGMRFVRTEGEPITVNLMEVV